jgi:hypothetical protein
MDKELESSLQQMMACFLAEMKASQEKMYAEMEARAEARHERFLARLDGLTSHRKGTMTCQRRRHVQKKWRLQTWKLL